MHQVEPGHDHVLMPARCLPSGALAFACLLSSLLVLLPSSSLAHGDEARPGPGLEAALVDPLPAEGLRIGVVLRDDSSSSKGGASAAGGPSAEAIARRAWIAARQQSVLDSLPTGGLTLGKRFTELRGFAGKADKATIRRLLAHPDVESVYLDGQVHKTLAQSGPLIGTGTAISRGLTGAGVSVAVLDSGIDTDHPHLMDDIAAEACFCDDRNGPFGCCPAGGETQTGAGASEDDDGHGTSVSGIITSSHTTYPGVAPDAEIVSIKVLNDTGNGNFSDIADALNWVISNRVTYSIRVVNLSLGDSGEYSSGAAVPCTGSNTATAIQILTDAGVTVLVASGNDGHDGGISFPACVPSAISVGGVYDEFLGTVGWCASTGCPDLLCQDLATVDTFVCHTNSSSILDVVAPDWRTWTTVLGGSFGNFGGTSAASPFAAAAAALLYEADVNLNAAQVKTLLTASSPQVLNSDNGLSFPRIDLDGAVETLLGPIDTDGDGIPDDGDDSGIAGDAFCTSGATTSCDDNCPSIVNSDQADPDGDGAGDVCDVCPNDPLDDVDGDGACGDVDVCPSVADPLQTDTDGDGAGDVCDACPNDPLDDVDGDGVCGDVDVCPSDSDPLQADADGDGAGDACDACPNDPFDDEDGDGVCGDVDICPSDSDPLQVDADGDGAGDACDLCPIDPLNDEDADGYCADLDNCPTVSNPDQLDTNENSIGDACEPPSEVPMGLLQRTLLMGALLCAGLIATRFAPWPPTRSGVE